LLLVNAGILAALLIWGYRADRYLYNCLAGPFTISQDELLRVINPRDMFRYFVTVDGLKPLETGLQNIEQTEDKYTHEVKSKKVTATYFAARVHDKLLLIKSPDATAVASYRGALLPVAADVHSWFQKELLDEKKLSFYSVFLPFFVDATSFRSNAYISLAVAVPIGLLAAYNVKRAITRMNDMQMSPIYKWLEHYDVPPAAVSHMIEQELKAGGTTISVGSLRLTSSWLLNRTFFHLDVVHLNEIVWIYQKVTKHYHNFIPTGKSYGVIVSDKWGRQIEVDLGRGKAKEDAPSFLHNLGSRIPWVVAGYSDELKRHYAKNRADFVAEVDERRKAFIRSEQGS
jgi:hypothetical protein